MMYPDITAEKEELFYYEKFALLLLIWFHTPTVPQDPSSHFIQRLTRVSSFRRGIIVETYVYEEFMFCNDVTLLFGCINYLPTTSLT